MSRLPEAQAEIDFDINNIKRNMLRLKIDISESKYGERAMVKFEIDSDEARAMVDSGFLAVSRNMTDAGIAIFEAVILLRPNLAAGYIGMCYAHLGAGNPEKAFEALKNAPPGYETDLFGGIALIRGGNIEQGRKRLEHVLTYSTDEGHKEIARSFLEGA